MKTFLTQNALARRVNMCHGTASKKILALKLAPDAILISGSVRPVTLWDTERLPELRAALTASKFITV